MHGLILNLSLPFWQVQPGNLCVWQTSRGQNPFKLDSG